MREIRVLAWCDVCADEDQRVESAESWTVGLTAGEDRPALRVLDLCDVHVKSLVAPLVALLANVGQTPELPPGKAPRTATGAAGPPSDQPVTCELCGRVYGRAGSLVNHLWIDHVGTKTRTPLPLKCGVPGCGFVAETRYGARMHRGAEHGITAADDAYAAARSAGARARA